MLVLYYPRYYAETTEELLRQCAIGIESYVHALCGFDRDALWRGWLDVLASHKEQSWPLVSALVSAAADHSGGPKTQSAVGMQEREREKKAVSDLLHNVLFNGALGRQAAEEGWCRELEHFLKHEKRMPVPSEIEHMRTALNRVKATISDLEREASAGNEVPALAVMRRLAEHWPHREARLAEQILKRAAA